ncbi:antibiotic biosynthesis monooxygenase [Streptosporangium sp. NPDC006007]|uniref:putative quinol monooxygenase n=1 Tax=Streptosporangium sp. NPDC006007 TaxID=3154575 RepID=UPI0033A1454B
MVTLGLFVLLEAKPGKEAEVEDFLRGALPLVEAESGTTAWFAIRLGTTTYAVFDAFPDEADRDAHLEGQVAEALRRQGGHLFAKAPAVNKLDVLAAKLPK